MAQMELKDLTKLMELDKTEQSLAEGLLSIASDNGITVDDVDELQDVIDYVQDNLGDYPDINKMQLSMFEKKLKEAGKGKKKSDSQKAVEGAAKAVAKTTAGTVGRQIGREAGEKLGGSFGKTLGGNVGAELGRKIIDVIKK